MPAAAPMALMETQAVEPVQFVHLLAIIVWTLPSTALPVC